MRVHYNHGDAEAYLEKYPRLRRWICQCNACQASGYLPELPEQIGTGVAAQTLRRYFRPLLLSERGLCDACEQMETTTPTSGEIGSRDI